MGSKALAKRMATTARLLRDMILHEMREQVGVYELWAQRREQGLPEIREEAFADLCAQVVCYGVFVASMQSGQSGQSGIMEAFPWPVVAEGGDDFFVHRLFAMVADRRGRIAGVVEQLGRELCEGELAAVIRELGRRDGTIHPVVHVYELFLEEYDATIRERRGVYYTPASVVAYIVKSVDEVLLSRFGMADGLAERHRVHVIDPAVGTGAFLQGVIDQVERRMRVSATEADPNWEAYVREHLLPRLHGVEVMPAPHAIAHLSLQARLAESGVKLRRGDRFDIRLGNSLEEAVQKALLSATGLGADEDVSPDAPVPVVIGNPPYANFGQMNHNLWIDDLLQTYKRGLRERKTNLHDDYIKFIRVAQWLVEQAGQGVVALVTNHSFLGGLTHRRMRESLLETFDEIFVLNLHGDVSERHLWPGDENVFEITRGVAITVMVRTKPNRSHASRVYYQELAGSREEKHAFLHANSLGTTSWQTLAPAGERFDFLPRSERHAAEYARHWPLPDLFNVAHSGIQTKRDKLAIHFDEASLADVLKRLREVKSEAELEAWREEQELGPDSSGWRLQAAAEDVRSADGVVLDVQYRPFDVRKTYFTGRSNGFLGRPRTEVTRQFLRPNLALAAMRQLAGVPDHCAVLATKQMLTDRALYSRNGTPYVFPLYSYAPMREPGDGTQSEGRQRTHNLNHRFLEALQASTGMRFIDETGGAREHEFGPEEVFAYLYAWLHAETYRERYADFLKKDFPRVPVEVGHEAFVRLARLGRRLVALHTFAPEEVEEEPAVRDPAGGNHRVEKVRYSEHDQRLYINEAQFFAPVTPGVWESRVGGYQVAAQWLKERRGRRLTAEDTLFFRRLLVMLARAEDVIREIDAVVQGSINNQNGYIW